MNDLITIHGDTGEKFPIDARELHAFVQVATRFNDWIDRRVREYGFLINTDFCSFLGKSQGGRPPVEYRLSISMAKELSMLENTETGKEARRYFIQCEEKMKALRAPRELSRLELAKMVVASETERIRLEEEKALVEVQRDEAIRTKALIGSHREASAMGKASAAAKKINKLEDELGIGKTYKAAKGIPWAKDYFTFGAKPNVVWGQIGKCLSSISAEMERDIRSVPHETYNRVNSYHVDVIDEFKRRLDGDQGILGRYRKQ